MQTKKQMYPKPDIGAQQATTFWNERHNHHANDYSLLLSDFCEMPQSSTGYPSSSRSPLHSGSKFSLAGSKVLTYRLREDTDLLPWVLLRCVVRLSLLVNGCVVQPGTQHGNCFFFKWTVSTWRFACSRLLNIFRFPFLSIQPANSQAYLLPSIITSQAIPDLLAPDFIRPDEPMYLRSQVVRLVRLVRPPLRLLFGRCFGVIGIASRICSANSNSS